MPVITCALLNDTVDPTLPHQPGALDEIADAALHSLECDSRYLVILTAHHLAKQIEHMRFADVKYNEKTAVYLNLVILFVIMPQISHTFLS